TVHEWASLFPVFMDEHGQFSHRRWLPGSLHPNQIEPVNHTLARGPYTGVLNSGHCQVNTCVVERSIDLEINTGEPCSILLDEILWEISTSLFVDSEMIWKSLLPTSPPVRPIQGLFLETSPITTVISDMRVRSQKLHPAPAFSNNINSHPRSVQFHLDT